MGSVVENFSLQTCGFVKKTIFKIESFCAYAAVFQETALGIAACPFVHLFVSFPDQLENPSRKISTATSSVYWQLIGSVRIKSLSRSLNENGIIVFGTYLWSK